MLDLFEKLNEKQKRLAIAYIRALLGDKESGDERKGEQQNDSLQS